MPKCSFIVSAYDRPDALALLLLSLKLQTEPDFEVIVCDNAAELEHPRPCIFDPRINWLWTGTTCANCYQSSNSGVQHATGEYLCFPSDDG